MRNRPPSLGVHVHGQHEPHLEPGRITTHDSRARDSGNNWTGRCIAVLRDKATITLCTEYTTESWHPLPRTTPYHTRPPRQEALWDRHLCAPRHLLACRAGHCRCIRQLATHSRLACSPLSLRPGQLGRSGAQQVTIATISIANAHRRLIDWRRYGTLPTAPACPNRLVLALPRASVHQYSRFTIASLPNLPIALPQTTKQCLLQALLSICRASQAS